MWAIHWQTFNLKKGVLWDQQRKEKDVAPEEKKDRALKKNDKNRAWGKVNKMAGKQQRDYWGDMSRRGDVRYTVSFGDKHDQLLTPLRFNCQNKKLVQAFCVFSWGDGPVTGKWAVAGKNAHIMSSTCNGMSKWKPLSQALYMYSIHSLCMGIVREQPWETVGRTRRNTTT